MYIEYSDFIYQRITELRELKGVSAREMSLALGQNSNYINKLENKEYLPSMQVFFYICEYFKITPSEFFQTDEVPQTPRYSNLLDQVEKFDDNTLNLITDVATRFNQEK